MEEYKIVVRSVDNTSFFTFSNKEDRRKFIMELPECVSYAMSDEPLSIEDQALQDKLDLEFEIYRRQK